MRPALQKVIEKLIKEKFHEIDSLAYEIKLEADRAQKEILEDPEQAPNIYSRYVTAAQKKMMQGQQKAEAIASQTKVNVAITKEDSIFPNIHLPGGISSKATEYKQLAAKGDEWRSPIFKLGSAPVSSDIANAPQVTRKDHSVSGGGVKGPQNIGNTNSMTNQLSDPVAQTNGHTNGGVTNGQFSTQVDKAFSNGNVNGKENGHTQLGVNNPVLNGST